MVQSLTWLPENAGDEVKKICSIITNHTGPFEDCHWYEDPEPFYSACLHDLTLYGKDNVMVYSAIGSYEQVCRAHGVTIHTWCPEGYCCLLDSCNILACSDDEWCGEADEKYTCNKYETHNRQDLYDFSLTCEGSKSCMSFSRSLLSANGIPAESLHLADPSCVGTLEDDRIVFPFGNISQSCGSQLKVNSTHAVYSNAVEGHFIQQKGPIILQDKLIHIDFSCAYPLSINLSFLWAIHVGPSVVNMLLPNGQGHLEASLILYKDSDYSQLIPVCPVILTINERVYISIEMADIDTTQFVLQLKSCWATPTIDPSSTTTWDLIRNECPVSIDGSVSLEGQNLPSIKRFSFSAFEFVGDSHMIYIHCQLNLCNIQTSLCSTMCSSRSARAVQASPEVEGSLISTGPILYGTDLTSDAHAYVKSSFNNKNNNDELHEIVIEEVQLSSSHPPAAACLLLMLPYWLVIIMS
ncbi:alpha-tectorin-like [Pleurodeles waltl]|uniref:alpha-tectorin-like n=1 Tax=Pleurodeles waltl TaxID=8319 RepID=UPI0037094EC2